MEAEEAEQAQHVLGQAVMRRADEAHAPRFEVGAPAGRVVERAVAVEIERVDGEIAPGRVGQPVVGEGDRGMAPVGLDVAAQGGDLEHRALDDRGHGAVGEPGRDHPDAAPLEQRRHPVGGRLGGDVDVLDRAAGEAVAHAAADEARRAVRRREARDEGSRRLRGHPRPGFDASRRFQRSAVQLPSEWRPGTTSPSISRAGW